MKKLLFPVALLAALVPGCAKQASLSEQAAAGNAAAPVRQLYVVPGATDSITMDVIGDYVNAGDNRLKNNTTLMSYATDQQGAGYANGSSLPAVPVIKTAAARYANSYALRYSLPARSASVVYDQADKDRLESHILANVPVNDCINNVHYSGFSLFIPSGKGVASKWCVIHQWHQSSPESPPISFNLLPGYYARLGLSVLWGADKAHSHGGFQPRADDSSGDTFIDLPRNKWIDFIVRWKLDPVGLTGVCAVYRHDIDATGSTLIFNYTGHIGYSNVTSPGINEKFGLYRYADSVNNLEIVYDQLRAGPAWNTVQPWP